MKQNLSMRDLFKTSKGNEYSYLHIVSKSGPTLLFLHGFPSHLHDWTSQIDYFASRSYGIVALDLLGYGQSSKPSDVNQYRLRSTSDEIVEILDFIGLSAVVGVGHDTGATLLSRMAIYHPSRIQSLVFLAVGPPPMGTSFNADMINQMTKEALGYEYVGYISWLGSDSGAQECLEADARSSMSLMFCSDPQLWTEWFRPLGKMKQFVSEAREVEIGAWYPAELQTQHMKSFGVKDGYAGAVNWYKMWLANLFVEDERGFEETKLPQHTLLVCEEGDNQQEHFLRAWAPEVDCAKVNSGHWIHLEKADEANKLIDDFLIRHLH